MNYYKNWKTVFQRTVFYYCPRKFKMKVGDRKMFERFVYDNIACNEYGIMCVSFDKNLPSTMSAQQSDLQTVKSALGDTYHIISQDYSEPLVYTMQVINRDFSPITQYQERELKKWLCKRGKYKLFSIFDKRYADIWFYANISNPKTIYIGDVYGMEFTITMNAPYGYSDIRDNTYRLDIDKSVTFYVDNDEELPIYPDIEIEMQQSGDFTMKNMSVEESILHPFEIKNVKSGEVITIKGSYPLISSSDVAHNNSIYIDTNKLWLYLVDGYNTIQVSLSCKIRLQYREYRKVGVV